MTTVNMKLKTCEVGLFRLPGVVLDKDEATPAKLEEIETWAKETNCGKKMTDLLWSFRNEKQRDMFILRWSTE